MGRLTKNSELTPGKSARQIYEALKEQIVGGVFGQTGMLPSSRGLAHELGVSRTTVTLAYEQLLAEGFIEVRQGARPRVAPDVVGTNAAGHGSKPSSSVFLSDYGHRIRDLPPAIEREAEKVIADFQHGDMARSDFPTAVWKRAMNTAMDEQPERLTYDDARGSRRLRTALQGYLWRARKLRCDLDQIVIVNGSQQGLDLCARLLLDAGDRFVIENPCYGMARDVFASIGATPASIAVDDEGMRTDQLSSVEARLAYVTPSHQFPLGSVMPISRRHQLLEWAQRQNACVIEDDYDSEYRYDINPVPPLYGLDNSGNVVYLGTISKTLSPTLRIGYLVVPAGLQDTFAAAKRLTDRHSPVIEQNVLASLIESGAYESHVRRMRRLNRERRETLLNVLRHKFADRIVVNGADAGLHIVVWLKDVPRSREAVLIENVRRLGVGLHSISSLYDAGVTDLPDDRVGLVMGYGALDIRRIERGVHVLASAVKHLAPGAP